MVSSVLLFQARAVLPKLGFGLHYRFMMLKVGLSVFSLHRYTEESFIGELFELVLIDPEFSPTVVLLATETGRLDCLAALLVWFLLFDGVCQHSNLYRYSLYYRLHP